MRAEDLLDMMLALAEQTVNDALRPTSISFNSVLTAWAKSGEKIAPFRSEAILEKDEGAIWLRPCIGQTEYTILYHGD
jgi:hypothetical protein